jgi:uncharacterized DUF497 family protein
MDRYEWDEEKRLRNLDKHGVDFVAMRSFDWDTAVRWPVVRGGEDRFVAYGRIALRLHVVVYTERRDMTRIISLRKANSREERDYEQRRIEGRDLR